VSTQWIALQKTYYPEMSQSTSHSNNWTELFLFRNSPAGGLLLRLYCLQVEMVTYICLHTHNMMI